MDPKTNYWYSAPEVVPDTGLHAGRDRESFPEVVESSAASTVNIKPEQWQINPNQHFSEAPNHEQYLDERHHPEGVYSGAGRPETYHPEQRYLDAQHPTDVGSHRNTEPRKYVCGLRAWLFWTVIVFITVVIAGAAVGVGVGVTMAQRSQTASAEGSSSSPTSSPVSPASTSPVSTALSEASSASASPTTTTMQSNTVTTTSVVGASTTLFRDCPSSDETIHDVTVGSKTYMFRKFCSTVLVSTKENNNHVSQTTTDLNTCINKCVLYNDENASKIAAGESDPCNTVCWWNNLDVQYPGACWGFTTGNSSAGEFQFEQQVICDSAGWINES